MLLYQNLLACQYIRTFSRSVFLPFNVTVHIKPFYYVSISDPFSMSVYQNLLVCQYIRTFSMSVFLLFNVTIHIKSF